MKLLLMCAFAATCASPCDRPNVIVILADDLGGNDLGYVNRDVISPNLDQLAREGVILKNNYVVNACTPTRHALMTGRYPFKTQMSHIVLLPTQPHCSPTDITFLPERFKQAGYRTYMTGKWHLGFCQEKCLPTSRGFDYMYGFYQGEQDYYIKTSGTGWDTPDGYDWRDGVDTDLSVNGTFDTYIINDWLVDQFEHYNSPDPFFLYLSFPNVNVPLKAPQKYYDLYSQEFPEHGPSRRDYLGLVTAMDDAVGNLTRLLKKNGLYDNTLILFSADNGGVHGFNADNMPYRGSKGSMFEGGVRALAFAHGPMLTKTGYEHEGLFHVTDWVPTLMKIIGNNRMNPIAEKIDGFDQSDMILHGADSRRDDIVFNIDMLPMAMMGQSAVRRGDWKLIWGHSGVTDGYGADLELFYENKANRRLIGLGPYQGSPGTRHEQASFDFSQENMEVMMRLTEYFAFDPDDINSGQVHLFNLTADPYEYENLAMRPEHQDKLLELKQYILDQLRHYVPVSEVGRTSRPEGDPIRYGGVWSTGWCEDRRILMDGDC